MDRWSAAEIVGHLVMLELAVLGGADRLTQKPIRFVEMRWIHRKSPIPLGRTMLSAKEELLG
jgi:hypothetical protein